MKKTTINPIRFSEITDKQKRKLVGKKFNVILDFTDGTTLGPLEGTFEKVKNEIPKH